MSNHTPSVIVGIPAYNEAANIEYLLQDLLRQKRQSYRLEKILVVSDGSSDATVEIARRFAGGGVEVIDNPIREGVAVRQNQIIDRSDSDILVIINADIALPDDSYIDSLISPILDERADLTSGGVDPLEPETVFGRIIEAGFCFVTGLFEMWRNGDNVYTCRGVGRAFSRRFYKQMRFNGSASEDPHSYFLCHSFGYEYVFVHSARAQIQLPQTWNDHRKQSLRFQGGTSQLSDRFGRKAVKFAYRIPKILVMQALLHALIRRPIAMAGYLGTTVITRMLGLFRSVYYTREQWDISSSSKRLNIDRFLSQK